ncbi:hypothetical protein [Actinopolyspora mortivallis]|nr:hypothetical protein [Actinopolyspora mortivallis]
MHGELHGRFRSPESALRLLSRRRRLHLVRLGSEPNGSGHAVPGSHGEP